MEIENLIRSTPCAVGLKPSATRGEARLRGLERIIYSKTIISGRRVGRAMFIAVVREVFNLV